MGQLVGAGELVVWEWEAVGETALVCVRQKAGVGRRVCVWLVVSEAVVFFGDRG